MCTVAFKKEKYNEEKRKRRGEEAHVTKDKDLSLLPSPSCAFCAKERKRVCSLQCDLMNEKKRAELLAQQVNKWSYTCKVVIVMTGAYVGDVRTRARAAYMNVIGLGKPP